MASVKIGVRLLETLTVALYEDPIILFREYVQNSVDAYKTARLDPSKEFAGFSTQITIDREKKTIEIRDNGYAISENEFKEAMTSIGKSKKRLNEHIGFRGIGRLSGLPFC